MRWPLRRQLMLPLLSVAGAILLAVGGINAQLAARRTQERIERQLEGVANVLASSNFPLSDGVLAKMRDLSRAEFVVTDEKGTPLASSLSNVPRALPNPAPANSRRLAGFGPVVDVQGAKYFHRVDQLAPRAGMPDAAVLHVLFPEVEYRGALREAIWPPLVVGAAAVVAVAAMSHLLAGRLSRAMNRLGNEVMRMAKGDFAPAELPAADDEIRDLSQAVNRTAEMLADYEQQVRRTEQVRTVALLGAGLAHEMRNAATGCRMALDLHADACRGPRDDESLVVARTQLQLMESQLQRFLKIGRPRSAVRRHSLDFSQLVDDLLPLVRPAARHAGVQLDWIKPNAETPIQGDQESLTQAVINVLLNAIEAVQQSDAPNSKQVRLELTRCDDRSAQLTICDDGPGPTESVARGLFDAFVTTKPEGVGLGLAFAKEVFDHHEGSIDWSRADGLTRFRLRLPLAEKGAACV
jgi:signal transduction histidine kinase